MTGNPTRADHPTLSVVCPTCGALERTPCHSLKPSMDTSPLALPVYLQNPHRARTRLARAERSSCATWCACPTCLSQTWKRLQLPSTTRYEHPLTVTTTAGVELAGDVRLVHSRHEDERARPWYASAHIDLTSLVEPDGGDLDVDTRDCATADEAVGLALASLRSILVLLDGALS